MYRSAIRRTMEQSKGKGKRAQRLIQQARELCDLNSELPGELRVLRERCRIEMAKMQPQVTNQVRGMLFALR